MYRVPIVCVFWLTATAYGHCGPAKGCGGPSDTPEDPGTVKAVLKNLQNRASSLKAYACRLDYTVRQPLLESQQRRRGTLRYGKFDGKAYLRIEFATLQQDDEKEQRHREEFFFDGVWLLHIDYTTESAERHQMAEPNRPIDPFVLASRHVPVLGFSKIQELDREFDVTLVRPEQRDEAMPIQVHLKVKPDSTYRDDYTTIDFWIDRKLGLPDKVVAVTTEQDVHEIRLLAPQVNDVPDPEIRNIRVPEGFSEDTVPLDRKAERKP
jgi:hypothetical protein